MNLSWHEITFHQSVNKVLTHPLLGFEEVYHPEVRMGNVVDTENQSQANKWEKMLTNKTANTPAINRKPLPNHITEQRGITREKYGPSES
jgi:hypothetical protein